jgi:hypothetical protein
MTIAQTSVAAGAVADATGAEWIKAQTAGASSGCGTVVVNAKDPNGDVTDETITFTLPACEFTGIRGMDSLAITGMLELTMPDATGFDFSAKATNLEFAFTESGSTSSETRNGTRQITATASSATLANDMTTQFVKAGASTGTLLNSLTLSFTPVSGSSLAVGHPLPNGTLTANGTVSWTPAAAGSSAESFIITTTTPLAYDASCVATSASPFDSGEVKVVVTDGSAKAYGKITWSGCAAPVITVI